MFFLQVHTAALGLARQRSGEEWRFGATFLSLEGNDDWSRGAHYIPWLEPGPQTSIYSGCFFLKHLHFCCLNVEQMKQIIGTVHRNWPKESKRGRQMERYGRSYLCIYIYNYIIIYIYIDIYLIHIYFYIYIHDIDILSIYIYIYLFRYRYVILYYLCTVFIYTINLSWIVLFHFLGVAITQGHQSIKNSLSTKVKKRVWRRFSGP